MFWQLAYNGTMELSRSCLMGMAFFLVLATSKYFHFGIALWFVVAPFAVSALLPEAASSVQALGIVAGVVATVGAVGAALEMILAEPLRSRGATPLQLMLVSLTTMTIGQTVVGMAVHGDQRRIHVGALAGDALPIGPIVMSRPQLAALVIGGGAAALVAIAWRRSAGGLFLRAIRESDLAAEAAGIPVQRWRVVAVAIGCGLASIAGIHQALDGFVSPTMGFDAAFGGLAAVLVGGRTYLWQPVLGAALITSARVVAGYLLAGSWEPAVTFGACLIALLVRPEWRQDKSAESFP